MEMELNDRERMIVGMYRMFNKDYSWIADRMTDEHGVEMSESQVGRVVRSMESNAEENGYMEEFRSVTMSGFVDIATGV